MAVELSQRARAFLQELRFAVLATINQDIYRLSARYHGEHKARRQMQEQFSKEVRMSLLLHPEHIVEYFD